MLSNTQNLLEDVEFYAEDAGRTDNDYLARVCEAVIKAGATVLNIRIRLATAYQKNMVKIRFLKRNVKELKKPNYLVIAIMT